MKQALVMSAVLLLGLMLTGCKKVQIVTKAELEKEKAEWVEPKLSIWYYAGRKNGYHYYIHIDTPGTKRFRVSEEEMIQNDPFPLTRSQKKWRFMGWGVHAPRKQQE